MRLGRVSIISLLVLTCGGACRGPVIDKGPRPQVGGTIAGMVTDSSGGAVVSRKVTAIDAATGARYEATTGANGGYTIKVPQGTYRLEVELRAGEMLREQPDETEVNNSDLDPGRNFVITAKPPGSS